jgi:uncharacterized membrane protein
MADLETTVAVYHDLRTAEADWSTLEDALEAHEIEIADAALVENSAGKPVVLHRQSHHGWGKGAIAGAVVGVLFPPSIIGSAIVGAGGGALVAHMMRSLGRGKVRDLGRTFDSGTIAIVIVTPTASTAQVTARLEGATTLESRVGGTSEDTMEALAMAAMGPMGPMGPGVNYA